jgi:DNA-binding CsgD family transcriptional regulator
LNWMTTTHACFSAICFAFGYKIFRLDFRSTLNRKLAASCVLFGFEELFASLYLIAPDLSLFWPFFNLAASCMVVAGATNIAALIDFAGIRRPWVNASLLAPMVIMIAIQVGLIWKGAWIVSGFRPSAGGNLLLPSGDPFANAINLIYVFLGVALGFSVLIYAWFRTRSARYRKITVLTFALAAFANIVGYLTTILARTRADLPDLSSLTMMIVIVGYTYLIQHYRHLSERNPDLTGLLLPLLKGTIMFVDKRGTILEAAEGAFRLLRTDPRRRNLTEVLPGWPQLAERWSEVRSSLEPIVDLKGQIGEGRFTLHLLPHRNPFDEFDGILVRIVPIGPIDETIVSYGLSSREQEVARMVCEGFDTHQVAEALYISPSTVKNHLHNIYEKTNTSGRSDLIRILLHSREAREAT